MEKPPQPAIPTPTAQDPQEPARWLGALLDQHGAALALYAAQWTNAADDCVQEALVELAGQAPRPNNPRAWLYVKVKHLALTAARSSRRRVNHEQNAWRDRLGGRITQTDSSTQRELVDALSQVSMEHREIVVLKTWGNFTFAEIAELCGESSSSVHRKYNAALEQLRKLWTQTRTNNPSKLNSISERTVPCQM